MDVQIVGHGYGHYSVLLRGEISTDDKINPDSTKMYVNDIPMEFSIGLGNYYERYPAFRLDLDEDSKLPDTLIFTIQLPGLSIQPIGYIHFKPLKDFVLDQDFSNELALDKTTSVAIDWGGDLPDELSVRRMVSTSTDRGEQVESSVITEGPYDKKKPFVLTRDMFTVPGGTAKAFYLKWSKNGFGKVTNERASFSISIVATVDQEIAIGEDE